MKSSGRLDRVDRLFLMVTNRCNARCRLCRYWQQESEKFLAPAFIEERVVPLIDQYNVGLTLITGGEPTLHPHLPDIVKILAESGSTVTLVTNATQLEPIFPAIKDDVDAYLFSLDAGNEALYREIRGLENFNRLLAWPGKIKAYRPYAQVAFNCLLQKKNVDNLVELYNMIADLPVEGIFFNVPEMKPHCFGRKGTVPAESWENALLDKKEIALLEENLNTIAAMDAGRGKLFQQRSFFDRCVQYFRALRQGQPHEFNDPRQVCQVPFTGIVVDESQALHTCFYLPDSICLGNGLNKSSIETVQHLGVGEEGMVNGENLMNTREEISTNIELRKKYCSFCLQFQG